ncbi:MAG: AAA family ATPase [Deltaproteobacteria bacterium]|nr:AAA family ATPase [Deltaproteobacteria bacterium]
MNKPEEAMQRTKEEKRNGGGERMPLEARDVSPTYSCTRVSLVDPARLRKNKIVSLFPEEALADQMKILHIQVLNKMEEIGGNSLLVASPNPAEGKTWTAINLALSMSQKLDQTVLLVDANVRAPAVHRFLGMDCPRGLSDYLLHQAEIPDLLVNPGIEKLVLLPAGSSLTNSVELLGSPRMEALVKEMKERYRDRFLIFDTPPLLSSADALVLSRFMDAVLLVVESEKTRIKDVVQAIEMLKHRQMIGAVVNRAKGPMR